MSNETEVFINGQAFSFDSPPTLKLVLESLKIHAPHIAVAVNEEIVPRSQMEKMFVRNGDRIEIVRAVAGG